MPNYSDIPYGLRIANTHLLPQYQIKASIYKEMTLVFVVSLSLSLLPGCMDSLSLSCRQPEKVTH